MNRRNRRLARGALGAVILVGAVMTSVGTAQAATAPVLTTTVDSGCADTTITISWPDPDPADGVTGWDVQAHANGATTWDGTSIASLGPSARSYTFNWDSEGQTVQLRVGALSAGGEAFSDPTSWINGPAPAPWGTTTASGSPTMTFTGADDPAQSQNIQLSWGAPTSGDPQVTLPPVLRYAVLLDGTVSDFQRVSPTSTSLSMTGTHQYAVTAQLTDCSLVSTPQISLDGVRYPGPVTLSLSTAPGHVLWTISPPSDPGSGININLEAQTSSDGGSSWSRSDGAAPVGSTLLVRARATSSDGSGPWTVRQSGVVPGWMAYSVTAVPIRNLAGPMGEALVGWTGPDSLHWRVVAQPSVAGFPMRVQEASDPLRSVVVAGLSPGVPYQISVAACTGDPINAPDSCWTPLTYANTITPTITPTAALGAVPFVTLGSSVTPTLSGKGYGSGIDFYDLRYRRATWNGAFSNYVYPSAWQGRTTATSLGLPQGSTTCLSVRAHDTAGDVGAWSADKCVVRPLDDRSLSASSGWVRGSASAYWLGTITATTHNNVSLVRTGAVLDRVGLVATRCASCGSVAIYVGSTLVGKASLYSATTRYRQLILLPRFSVRSGTVTVRSLTSLKRVQVDGFVVTRL